MAMPQLSLADLTQRYGGSWIEIIKDGEVKPILVYVNFFEDHLVFVETEHGSQRFTKSRVTITRDFPDMGAVNYVNCVHLISRNPIRNWCRGLTHAHIMDSCRNQSAPKFSSALKHSEVYAMFNRVWIPLKEGFESLKSGHRMSFAINKTYWFSGNKKHTYLWRNKICVGEVLNEHLFFFNESSILQEEIKTDLRGYPIC